MDLRSLNGVELKLNKIYSNNARYRSRIYLHQLTRRMRFAFG